MVSRREDELEELGRVDAEKAKTKRGKRRLKAEKKRVVGEIIKKDRQAKPVKTRVRRVEKGKRKWHGGREKFAKIDNGDRIDEAILRLIHVDHPVDMLDILTNIERLILGKYK